MLEKLTCHSMPELVEVTELLSHSLICGMFHMREMGGHIYPVNLLCPGLYQRITCRSAKTSDLQYLLLCKLNPP